MDPVEQLILTHRRFVRRIAYRLACEHSGDKVEFERDGLVGLVEADIAKLFGVTESRVGQIVKQALAEMRSVAVEHGVSFPDVWW